MTEPGGQPRILVIRRENIGDLVCTTPLIRALREQLPRAWIGALVTRYNAAVLERNPDLDAVYAYQKAKHREADEGLAAIYWDRLRTIAALRRRHLDWALLPGGPHASALRFARWIAPRQTLVRGPQDRSVGAHEAEQCCSLLARMGLRYAVPAARVVPDPATAHALAERVGTQLGRTPLSIVGVHVSARKPSQRWAADRFAALIRQMAATPEVAFLLLWAPGSERSARHPGDDEKAAHILGLLDGLPVVPVATQRLDELIAALSLCDRVICADGGAMHLAAALGKPLVCLFGDSDPAHWGPWRVPHQLLQPASRNVADIMVEDIMQADLRLRAQLAAGREP